MTKQLTQDVFKDAPPWVKSAVVDGDGTASFWSKPKTELKIWEKYNIWTFETPLRNGDAVSRIGTGYDTADWQNSAIDRENEDESN